MMRKLLAVIVLLWVVSPAVAQTGTAKSNGALNTEVGTNLPSGGSPPISASNLRQTLVDVVASYINGGAVNNLAGRGGGFDVWQRSTSIAVGASTTAYTNDGWYLLTLANEASTVSQVTGTAVGSLFAAKVQRNSGQTGTGVIRYAMPLDKDESSQAQGSFVTLSFTIQEGTNQSFSHAVNYFLYCGTGAVAKRGSTGYTGETSVISGTATTTTTATRVTATSAAIFPANCVQTEIQFNITPSGTAGVDDSFTVDDLQLEVVADASATASNYARQSLQPQNQKAKRFLHAIVPGAINVNVAPCMAVNTTQPLCSFPLQTTMRATPSLTVSAVGDWTIEINGSTLATTFTAMVIGGGTLDYTEILGTTPTTLTTSAMSFLRSANGSAAIYFTAEI